MDNFLEFWYVKCQVNFGGRIGLAATPLYHVELPSKHHGWWETSRLIFPHVTLA